MSYKFQRLREKLREAVASGEFSGKLPGERALAKRFHVNAKTLSKALTDLAAEGLLDRSIGRGTYIKGTAPAGTSARRWLLVCEPGQTDSPMVNHFRRMNADCEVATNVLRVRPSFLNQFQAVIDLASETPEAFLRDLVVRNLPVVVVGREPRTYSMHAILADSALGMAKIARDLIFGGHRKLLAVEPAGGAGVAIALRLAARRYAPATCIDVVCPEEPGAVIEEISRGGFTAVICYSPESAGRVTAAFAAAGVRIPHDVSVAAAGCTSNVQDIPCTGYFVSCEKMAGAAIQLLQDAPARPTTFWIPGEFVDRDTVAGIAAQRSIDTIEVAPSLRMGGVLV